MIRPARHHRNVCFGLFAALMGCVGCGGVEARTLTVVPASLEVTCQGKPAAMARVTLHPAQDPADDVVAARPTGIVGPDGVVRLTSYVSEDGAPEGTYVATVIWLAGPEPTNDSDPWPADRLRGRFADPNRSPLRVTIQNGAGPVRLVIPK